VKGAVMYCPECRHEVFIERVRDVRCGLCKVRFGRDVQMQVDTSAGDLRSEVEREADRG